MRVTTRFSLFSNFRKLFSPVSHSGMWKRPRSNFRKRKDLLTGRGLEAIFQLELDSSSATLSISIFGRRGQRGIRVQNESDPFPWVFGAKIQNLLLFFLFVETLPPPVPENFSGHGEVGGHFGPVFFHELILSTSSRTRVPNRAKTVWWLK